MNWSAQQERALAAVKRWLDAGYQPDHPFYYLGGFAGTGKTTLAKYLAEGIEGRVEFCAYTGKAALVLRQKGCSTARTIHNLIYRVTGDPSEGATLRLAAAMAEKEEAEKAYRAQHEQWKKSGGVGVNFALVNSPERKKIEELEKEIAEIEARSSRQPGFRLNSESDARIAKLIIVDECSMVDARIGYDLISFGVPILVLGDPAQLPPVMGEGFFTKGQPDFLLTEIHRQAADSGILRLATKVREGRYPELSDADADVQIFRAADKAAIRSAALGMEQILVGRNKTRHALNRRVRQLRDLPGETPVAGDRLVCLRNDYDVGLLNGSMWECVKYAGDSVIAAMTVRSLDEDRPAIPVSAHVAHFLGRGDEIKPYERREAQEFAFGYALTVHKSQGSQWPSVAVIDESTTFGDGNWHRHLYTAITRAADRLAVVI